MNYDRHRTPTQLNLGLMYFYHVNGVGEKRVARMGEKERGESPYKHAELDIFLLDNVDEGWCSSRQKDSS